MREKYYVLIKGEDSLFYQSYSDKNDMLKYLGENEAGEVINNVTIHALNQLALEKTKEPFTIEKGILSEEKIKEISSLFIEKGALEILYDTRQQNVVSEAIKQLQNGRKK